MRSRCFSTLLAALVSLGLALDPARASGPLRFTADGRPYRLDPTRPARLVVDAGPLAARTHAQAAALVGPALRVWEAVPTARLRFELVGDLQQDIDGHNVIAFLSQLKDGDPCPILFDSDGSITSTLFGEGAVRDIFGVTVPWWGEPNSAQYTLGLLIFNGRETSLYSDEYNTEAIAHELGHLVGLEHSQLNQEVIQDGDPADDALAPVMSYSWGPNTRPRLHREDEAWFSWLYPSPQFATSTGSIRGRVLLPDRKTGLMGIMVVARRVGDPEVTAVSGVSGFQFGGADSYPQDVARPGDFRWATERDSGVYDLERLGEFLIPGLPPGAYILELQQLQDTPAVPRTGYLIGGPMVWQQDSLTKARPGSSTPIVVSAGQEVSGIDFVVNGEDPGEPQPVAEQEPNPWYHPQAVRLPAVIEGAVEGNAGSVSLIPSGSEQVDDFYRVRLAEWTTVTAVLSATEPAADLDLYVLKLETGGSSVEATARAPGTPPEILQQRLAPGDYLFGVYHAGGPASAYTLRLLGTPAPDPPPATGLEELEYLLISDITETSAVAHWRLTRAAPAVLQYGQPLREAAAPRAREHTNLLTGLPSGVRVPFQLYVGPLGQLRGVRRGLTAAKPAVPGGAPQVVVDGSFGRVNGEYLGRDTALVGVEVRNLGDGEALNVRIESVEVATGWELTSEMLSGTGLPPSLEVGRMGPGAEGLFVVSLMQRYGPTDPAITLHGSYTDAAGTVHRF